MTRFNLGNREKIQSIWTFLLFNEPKPGKPHTSTLHWTLGGERYDLTPEKQQRNFSLKYQITNHARRCVHGFSDLTRTCQSTALPGYSQRIQLIVFLTWKSAENDFNKLFYIFINAMLFPACLNNTQKILFLWFSRKLISYIITFIMNFKEEFTSLHPFHHLCVL